MEAVFFVIFKGELIINKTNNSKYNVEKKTSKCKHSVHSLSAQVSRAQTLNATFLSCTFSVRRKFWFTTTALLAQLLALIPGGSGMTRVCVCVYRDDITADTK